MSRMIAALALVLALISIGLNVVLLARLNTVRVGAVQTLDHASTRLGDLQDVTFRHDVQLRQTFPVSGELPFVQQLVIPINVAVPVNATAHASVNTPFGPLDVPVNVNTSVPISLEVPVAISRTVPYSLTVPINLDLPIEIRLRDLGIQAAIQEAQDEIARLRATLQ